MTDTIYPEIHRPTGGKPTFPAVCPVCGARMTIERDDSYGAGYACGGSYSPKPQIQNHTDKWWGECGKK